MKKKDKDLTLKKALTVEPSQKCEEALFSKIDALEKQQESTSSKGFWGSFRLSFALPVLTCLLLLGFFSMSVYKEEFQETPVLTSEQELSVEDFEVSVIVEENIDFEALGLMEDLNLEEEDLDLLLLSDFNLKGLR